MEQVIPQLEHVSFNCGDIAMISDRQFQADLFCNIKHLRITSAFNNLEFISICFLKRFYNLENLEVMGCNFKELSPYKGDAGEDKDMVTTLPKLKKLKLDYVSNTRLMWTQEGHISTSLEILAIWKCHSLINLGSYFSTLQNLTILDVWRCKGMRELVTSSKAQSLVCLVTMRIEECEMMREVVASEGDETTYEIIFEKLKCLEFHCLLNLKSFCSGNHTFRFPSLEQVILSQCPKINNFCQGVLSTPKLQKVQLTKTDFKGRWVGDLNATVDQLYKEQVGYRGLKHLKFSEFPELEDVWSRNPQEMLYFKSLEYLEVCDSDKLRCIFNLSVALSLGRLQQLEIKRCNHLEHVIKDVDSDTVAEEAMITDGNKITTVFPNLRSIVLESCSNMTSFYLGSKALECPSLKRIMVAECPNMTTFVSTFSRNGDEEAIIGDETDTFFSDKVIPQLEQVSFDVGDIAMINDHQFDADFFCNIRHLHIISPLGETNVFPFCFLQRFYNLDTLEVGSGHFKELSPSEDDAGEAKEVITMLPKIKKLKLDCVTNTRLLWTQGDHISASLESLEVWQCPSLINLGSYFSTLQNLTTLDVWKCKGITELITSCTAQSLVCLVTMRIRECETMREVVASQGDETADEIVFENLKCLELHCLLSLKSFCSGNHTFKFPSLELVTVIQCPKINNFCQGVLSTPKLQKVQLTKTDFKGRWVGDLNATVDQLYKEQVGYRGLKHLKFSLFPELVDIWSRNPQEMMDLKSVEFLEVCDLDNLICIFNLSVVVSLGRLRQLEIKRCSHLEQVIKEKDSNTDGSKTITIFPNLQSIVLESCSNMTSFYLGSTTLECPSLKEIMVADCPNMTTFVSTFSRKGNEEAIIGDEADTFFSDKGKSILPPVAFGKARTDLKEKFQVHNYTRKPILPMGPKVVRWCPPSFPMLKLNVDGAFRIEDRSGAVGFVVRNSVGLVLGGGACFIREAYSADFVEAQAVIHALRFASSKGFKIVIIECGTLAVASKLKKKLPDFSMLGLFLEEAKQLMNSFEDVQVCYVHRLGNRVAHALASFGFDCNEPFTFGSNYPDFIKELVLSCM
ncbi:hypothetical protein V6N13_103175 [Hibiscus sabdariffa]